MFRTVLESRTGIAASLAPLRTTGLLGGRKSVDIMQALVAVVPAEPEVGLAPGNKLYQFLLEFCSHFNGF